MSMNNPKDGRFNVTDADDIGYNVSSNESFVSVMNSRVCRRTFLGAGAVSAVGVLLESGGLFSCSSSSGVPNAKMQDTVPSEKLLGFQAVAKTLADRVTVPAGYAVQVLYALGDPLTEETFPYQNDGTDTDFENRAGDHHDGMEFFGLSDIGMPSAVANDRGLLAINHEATTNEKLSSFFLHMHGGTPTLPRPVVEVEKEMAVHGISIIEVRKNGGTWQYVKTSLFNRRFTTQTAMEISGPARGSSLLVTCYSTDGIRTRGTLNNCGTGKSPWGTFVSGEENWYGYFSRSAADDQVRGNDKSVISLRRYGRPAGATTRHGWETGGTEDKYIRWNISKTGASTDGSDDYRNEMNGMGFMVEIDPYDKTRIAKKRSALGRFAKESAGFSKPVVGQPIVVYMGDDARNEYIYKWVSTANWDAADAQAANRMAVGDKYLDHGKLYVAKFKPDGTGQWIELSITYPAIADYKVYPFADQADVLLNARLAGDAVGATKMDRPEWAAVNPANGEIYFSLTNNSSRRVESSDSSHLLPDSANPRSYIDRNDKKMQQGNPNGHILRIKEGVGASAATTFIWDVYLFGAEAKASQDRINLSKLTDSQDFSSPDGLAFSQATGICWIQTDDNAYTDVTNCMMLAGLPGQVGDGNQVTLRYPRASGVPLEVKTYAGKVPREDTLKRFLVGPVGCEITGICETSDGKTMFVNIQHPGENTRHADISDPTRYTSQWPSNTGYGAGKRPRSATIVITKNDGGRIGS